MQNHIRVLDAYGIRKQIQTEAEKMNLGFVISVIGFGYGLFSSST